MSKVSNLIFVDESGDPGAPFAFNEKGEKIPTGTSAFYIISAICIDEKSLYLLENRMMEVKTQFGYKKEIKSNDISLLLYKALLELLNELKIKTFYRLVDKEKYKGVFKVDGERHLHNVFDEYNLVKAVAHAIQECDLKEVEVVIDRTDRRLLDGKFDSFNSYLLKRVKKVIRDVEKKDRIAWITHINSVYANVMQMSDIVGGAIRDDFTQKNTELLGVISKELLIRVP